MVLTWTDQFIFSREREKLRMERERIERQKQELMRLEREQQRLEREKLERERDELRKQQMKYEEVRRGVKRSPQDRRPDYFDDRKRPRGSPDRSSGSRGGPPSRGGDRNNRPGPPPDMRGGPGRFDRPSEGNRYDRGGNSGSSSRGGHHRQYERDDRRPSGRNDDRSDHRSGPSNSGPSRPSRDYNGTSSGGPMDSWRSGGAPPPHQKTPYGGGSGSMLGNVMTSNRSGMDNSTWRPPLSTNERWGGNNTGASRGTNMMQYRMPMNSMPLMSSMMPTDRFSLNNFRK